MNLSKCPTRFTYTEYGALIGCPETFLPLFFCCLHAEDQGPSLSQRYAQHEEYVRCLGQNTAGRKECSPLEGNPSRHLGKIVLADDPVAADVACTRLTRLKPRRIWHLDRASHFLGNERGRIDLICVGDAATDRVI